MSQPTTFPYRLAALLALVLIAQAPALAHAAPSIPWVSLLGAGALDGHPRGANHIGGLTVEELEDGTTVLRIQGSRKPTFNVYRLSDPERLVVDIAGSEPDGVVPHVPLDTWACGRVTVDGVQERDASLVRVVIELRREASYIVLPKDAELVVTVTPRELAPEAYFARKSADERRAEIERSARDAKALRAEARALSSRARAQAAEADRRVGQARRDAEAARQAEQRAKAAERRAATAEAQARQTLAEAKRGRLRLRRALRQAEQARVEARAECERAQAERTRAEGVLAKARTELEAERQRLAEARSRTEAERQQLSKARSQTEAERQELSRARSQAEVERQRLARAEQDAARTKQSAAALEQQAKASLARAEQALSEAEAERRAAVSARTRAEQALALAEREVKKAERRGSMTAELQRSLQQAKQAKAEAERRVKVAHGEVAQLERDRDALEAELSRKRTASEALDGEIAERSEELASLERKVADAREQLARAATAPVAEPPRSASPKAKAKAGPEPERTRTRGAEAAPRAFIRDVRFEDDDDESRVIVEVDGPVRFEGRTLTPDLQLLTLEGARIDPRLERSLDASAYAGPVERITSFAEDGGAKVIVATRGPVGPRLEQTDGTLVWHFPHGPSPAPAAAARSGSRRSPTHEVASLPSAKVGGFATSSPPLAAMVAPAPSGSRTIGPTDRAPSPSAARGGTRWRGERIDIELQDAPIKDVLLLFSDIGRVNIIAGRGVEGTVSMKLTAVPWDQALDIILRSLELGMVREGNVIRVATAEDLESERRQAIEQANARVQLKPLETRLVPISYATVDEMIPKVQSVLSPRGTVTPDSRTNTLIIMDVAENIALAEQLVASLDTQTPQVLIEARIVEARTNFQRTLGIQWGFDFTASPGTGNPTGLLFPNSVGLGGGATGVPQDTRGLVLPGSAANPNYVVDLPAPVGTGSGGALGFSFGSINGNLNTNLRLSQLEETGEVRIISAPKIVTLDNSEAQIEQGVQIPISQVSAQGVNTRFVNATLSLRVTPHVTNEGAVLLDVQVQKNEADFVNTGARGDPTILTKQARSRMLVNDSDTAVIGGIYTRNRAVNFSKVPWLADIPIIGWFFKNKNEADTRSEVLIFLTPKIVNRASSIGG